MLTLTDIEWNQISQWFITFKHVFKCHWDNKLICDKGEWREWLKKSLTSRTRSAAFSIVGCCAFFPCQLMCLTFPASQTAVPSASWDWIRSSRARFTNSVIMEGTLSEDTVSWRTGATLTALSVAFWVRIFILIIGTSERELEISFKRIKWKPTITTQNKKKKNNHVLDTIETDEQDKVNCKW